MAFETVESVDEILEFAIPPGVGFDDKLSFGERVFDSTAIFLNFVFQLIWMIVCFVIWIAIGAPIFILFWLIASIFDILSKPFRRDPI